MILRRKITSYILAILIIISVLVFTGFITFFLVKINSKQPFIGFENNSLPFAGIFTLFTTFKFIERRKFKK